MLSTQSLLHSMEKEYSKSSLSIDDQNIALDVIVANSLLCGDYETYRSVAVLGRAHNKLVEDTYRKDKKRIKDVMREKKIDLEPWRISWNKDFSRCTWINKPVENNNNRWELVLMGLHDNDVVIKNYVTQEHSVPVFYEYPRSYFTKDGEAFCHMYAYRTRCGRITFSRTTSREIMQMKYDFSGHTSDIVCAIGMEDNSAPWMLRMLNYPYCVRDFLRSTDVRLIDNPVYGCVKQYHIRGVTVSNCYKGFEKYSPGGGINYSSGYSVLPEDFRNIMDDLFAKQQAEKKNQNLQIK
jgi:hypothetical protein